MTFNKRQFIFVDINYFPDINAKQVSSSKQVIAIDEYNHADIASVVSIVNRLFFIKQELYNFSILLYINIH